VTNKAPDRSSLMVTNISHSPAETEQLGEAWGRKAESGLVIGLCGDLGAGKTHFVKGLARGLGITARVHSPTFALVNEYSGGRLPLFHLDLYRLETPAQIASAGLEEFLHPAGVAVIEWAERWPALRKPDSHLRPTLQPLPRVRWVRIETLSETDRRFIYEDSGD
jgi:tRNA threonylcarbamoyladenosine biosynthesis protein TsaE